MSFGNFLRRLSFDTEKLQGDATESAEGSTSSSSILTAPTKLIQSVNLKTGTLVSDLNQKLDLGGKFDSLKQVSVTKLENVVWGSTSSKDEIVTNQMKESVTQPPARSAVTRDAHSNPFNSPQPNQTAQSMDRTDVSTGSQDSQDKAPLRRQSTNAGPRPPRPPPPTAAALSRAMSVDQANIAMNYGKECKATKPHFMPETLEEEEDRSVVGPFSSEPQTAEAEDGSSASEYGAYGDRPVYKPDDEPGIEARSIHTGADIGSNELQEGGISAEKIESVLSDCVPALINGTWYLVQSREAELQDVLATSTGRMEFVNRIEQESVKTQGQLDPSVLPALLDKISLLLNECEDAEDFAPAKKILTVSLLLYIIDSGAPNDRTFLFNYIKSQPIWQSLRFWNACFFQSVQEARAKSAEQSGVEKKPEEIACEQLKSYLHTMNVFDLHETIKYEFLRKHSNLFNLTDDATQTLSAVIDGGTS